MAITDEIKILLTALSGELLRGDRAKIAEKVNKTRQYVTAVLSPNYDEYDEDIIDAAVKIVEKRKAKLKKQTALIG